MKIITNWKDSKCNDCGKEEIATEAGEGIVFCSFCFSQNLITKSHQKFQPIWKKDSRNPLRKHYQIWSRHMRRESDHARL